MEMKAYRLPPLPDLRMLRHRQRPDAWEESSTAVWGFTAYLAQLLGAERVSVTLRYDYDPSRKGPERLRLYLLITPGHDREGVPMLDLSKHEADIKAALTLLRQWWGGEAAPEPVDGATMLPDESTFAALCQLRLRDRIECVDAAEGKGLEPAYWVARWGDGLTRAWQAQRWDAFFDSLYEPVLVDIALVRMDWEQPDGQGNSLAIDLHNEIRVLAGKSSPRGGLGSASRRLQTREEAQRERRSLGAERLRKAFDTLLDDLHQGQVYRFNLRVMARRMDECHRTASRIALQLAPDGVLEVVKHSQHVRKALRGGFHLFFNKKEQHYSPTFSSGQQMRLPCLVRGVQEADVMRWKRLSQLRNIIPAAAALELMRLPVPQNGHLKTLWLETESPDAGWQEPVISLGCEPDRPVSAHIPLSQLNKHLFVAGVTGSGKTTTLVEILCQLTEQNIPFLIIEPSKREYRGLIAHPDLHQRLRVYTCGDDELSPLKLNPFEFDRERVRLDEHLGMLEACFKGALPLFSPLTEILLQTLQQAYLDQGWGKRDKTKRAPFPAMRDLLSALDRVLDDFQYSDRIALDLRTAARVRLASLTQRTVGRVFDSAVALPPVEELLAHPTLIELDKLSQEHANLVTLFLLQAINRYLRINPDAGGGLRHVLVIEEAHNIVGTHGTVAGGENSVDPRAEAAAFMVKMLAEVRALGMGIIIADQTPAAVAPEVLKNTGVKVVHRTVSGDDRDCLAEAMLLEPAQSDELARLMRGECFLYHEHLYGPQRARVVLKASRKDDFDLQTVADTSLDAWLSEQDWHKQQCKERLRQWLAAGFEGQWQSRMNAYRKIRQQAAQAQPGLRQRHRREAEAQSRALRDWLQEQLCPWGGRSLRQAIEAHRRACLSALEELEAVWPLPAAPAVDSGAEPSAFLRDLKPAVRQRWLERVEILQEAITQLQDELPVVRCLLEREEASGALADYTDAVRTVGERLYGERWRQLIRELEADLHGHPKAEAYFRLRFDRQRERYDALATAIEAVTNECEK